MPMFQTLAVWAAVITSSAAKRLRFSTLNARMKPIMIGIRQATRAVVLGTTNDSTNPTSIAPMTMWFARASTRDSTNNAMRRSSPVTVIAAAMRQAAATRATALLENPDSARLSAAAVPMAVPAGFAASGAYASRKTISAPITTPLTA